LSQSAVLPALVTKAHCGSHQPNLSKLRQIQCIANHHSAAGGITQLQF